ncbi:MAG TPA: peptidylprolyl isomerase [Nannocystis sp.]
MFRFVPRLSLGLCLAFAVACQPSGPSPQKTDEKAAPEPNKGSSEGSLPALPDPIATVNDVAIPLSQFKEIYDLKVKKYTDRGREIPPSADRRYRKSITERLIYNEILRQEAKARGIEVDAAKLAEREAQQKQGIKEWDKHLQRRGETEQSLRDMYIAEILEQQFLEKDGKLVVTDAEIDEEYEKIKPNYKSDGERIHAAHILIPIGPQDQQTQTGEKPPEPTPEEKERWRKEALAKAEELYKKATAPGADFAQLARENSVGPSADKGGDLGIFAKDRMVEEFSVVAFKLKPGEISKPVETKFGIHIIKVLAKYPPGDLPKEALVDQIRERLAQRKLHQGRRELKDALLAKYTVKNTMEELLGPDPRGPKRPPVVNPSEMPAGHPPVELKAKRADAKADGKVEATPTDKPE